MIDFIDYCTRFASFMDRGVTFLSRTSNDFIFLKDSHEIFQIQEVENIDDLSEDIFKIKQMFFKKYGLFFIITDKFAWGYYTFENQDTLKKEPFHNILELLINSSEKVLSTQLQKQIKNDIKEIIKKDTELELTDEIKNNIYDFLENCKFKYNNFTVTFENKKQDFAFFKCLCHDVERIDESVMLRYTSLESLINLLNDKYLTMMGITAMNDRTESDKINVSSSSVNDYYILSGTLKESKDNLTMWRLYGNNSKGVCLEFECNTTHKDDYYFSKIYYDCSRIKDSIKELLNNIKNEIYTNSRLIMEFPFVYYMSFFFKLNDYELENEYRMIFCQDSNIEKEFVLPYSKKLISPIHKIDIFSSDSPLKLKEITLGPNCPYKEENISQIQKLLFNRGIYDISLKQSNIEHFCS